MNACECGHDPVDHDTDDGWCGAEDEPEKPCICPRYQWQGAE